MIPMVEKVKYHLIAYHLIAMEYARNKLEKDLSTIPLTYSIKTDPEKLIYIINRLKTAYTTYHNSIEYHKLHAMQFLPTDDEIEKSKNKRNRENEALSNIFLKDKKGLSGSEFKSADKLNEE